VDPHQAIKSLTNMASIKVVNDSLMSNEYLSEFKGSKSHIIDDTMHLFKKSPFIEPSLREVSGDRS
jgi:hypothetical protein